MYGAIGQGNRLEINRISILKHYFLIYICALQPLSIYIVHVHNIYAYKVTKPSFGFVEVIFAFDFPKLSYNKNGNFTKKGFHYSLIQ